MALQESGVKLVAQDQAAFYAALAAANSAVQALGVSSAGSAAQIDKLTGRIEFQQRTLGILAQELDATKAKYGEGSVQAQRKQLALDKLTASIAKDESALAQLQAAEAGAAQSGDKLGNSLDKAGASGSKFGEIMTGALRKVGELAVNALASAAQALGSFIATSVKGAGDYEQSMNVLQSTTGATDVQMRAVKETAKALGADLTLPATSAASAGDAMLYLSQQGLSVDDAMKAAKGTLQLAAAGMVDEKVAAETTATALNQFHLAGSEATRVADLLAASVSASGSNVAQTGQAVQQAGTAFAGAKVPLADFVTLINEMSKAGIKGSDAGTSLKTMMQRLQAPTDKAKAALDDLNISVYDQAGAMRPMREIIGQFEGSLKGLTQQQRDQKIVTIFGSDAQRAANIILAGGTDAYDKMRVAVDRNGAAATLAGAQMKGLNGAVAGLGSQLETLALEALEPLLPIMAGAVTKAAEFAGSFVGKVGPAVEGIIAGIQTLAGIIQTAAQPAIGAVTAATIAYVVSAVGPVLADVPAMTAVLILNTAEWVHNAAAVLAAVAPYAAIAAAVAGVIFVQQQLNEKIAAHTNTLLGGRQAWKDSTAALEEFGKATAEDQAKLQPYADNISALRDRLREFVQQMGNRMQAGKESDARYAEDVAQVQSYETAIRVGSQALVEQQTQLEKTNQAMGESEIRTEAMTQKQKNHQEQIQLDQEEYKKLAKTIEDTYKRGTEAIDSYIGAALDAQDKITKAITSGNQEQAKEVAKNYAEQAVAARASIGQQLSDWTVAYAQMHNVSREVTDKILGQIESTFGTAGTVGARTMLGLQGDIEHAMTEGGKSIDTLGGKLNDDTDDAIVLKQKMDALKGKYEAEVIHNFDPTKQSVLDLLHEIEKIPERVTTEILTTHVDKYITEGTHAPGAGQAAGGPVEGGTTYLVGEHGREFFTPWTAGVITPHDRTIQPPATPAQIMQGGRATSNSYSEQKVYNYSPVYAGTPRAPATDFALMKVLGL